MTNTILTMDEYQQQAINAEIKTLEKSLLALRHRNALAPISSLPTEVITAIFYLLREQYLALPVSHVCHRWREIALAHPLFWSHLDFTTISPAGATEILSRTGVAPLYLEAIVPADRWQDARFVAFQKVLQTHVSHIYRLRIKALPLHLNRVLEGLISPAPILAHLSLSTEYDYEEPLQASIPDTLFDATTPKLSSLELIDCSIIWKSPLFKSLKHLETISLSRIVRPSLTDWLDALDEMPQLRSLSLQPASPSTTPFPFEIKRTVTLPSLACLDISDSELDCALALSHLVLPSLTSLCVATMSNQPTLVGVQVMLPYVAQHAHGPQDVQPLQRVIISHSWALLVINAWPMPDFEDTEGHSQRLVLSIYIYVPNDSVAILDAVTAALPLNSLVSLTAPCNTQFGFDEHFWRRHGSRWPLLRHVRLAPFPAHGFREMLLQDSGGRECPLFPSLTRLDLMNGVLSARRTRCLCDTFMKRVEQGVPLEVLDLRSCTATSLAIRLLSEIVLDVWVPEKLESVRTSGSIDLTWDETHSFVSDDKSEEGDWW